MADTLKGEDVHSVEGLLADAMRSGHGLFDESGFHGDTIQSGQHQGTNRK